MLRTSFNRFIVICFLVVFLCACGKQEALGTDEYVDSQSLGFYRHIAGRMDDETGWYYQFFEEVKKNDESPPLYLFQGLNLRYRYDEKYWSYNYVADQKKDGTPVYYRLKSKSGALRFGEGGSDQLADRAVINEILHGSPSAIDLIRKVREEREHYQFRTIDREMFFDLVNEGMTSPACEPGTSMLYWNKPSYAVEVEPDYVKGYKFQVAFVMRAGRIGELYIDVLFRNGEAYNDYYQLSDLVQAQKADEGQKKAFALLQSIRSSIKEENSFIANVEEYKDQKHGGIDFSRLYVFLKDIHNNSDERYDNMNENPPQILEEISKEEFEAANGQR